MSHNYAHIYTKYSKIKNKGRNNYGNNFIFTTNMPTM